MSVPDTLRCLFTATVERRGDSYVVSIPESELDAGVIDEGESYRVGVFDAATGGDATASEAAPTENRRSRNDRASGQGGDPGRQARSPPVEEGEVRKVEIESIGDQGDGIAKVERGFVIIVPGTDVGDEVEVEIERVMENVAFARPVEETDAADASAY
jgi:predicted RNA-binding protein with TRAM domain